MASFICGVAGLGFGVLFEVESSFWDKQIVKFLPRAKMEGDEGFADGLWRYVSLNLLKFEHNLTAEVLEVVYEVVEKFGSAELMVDVRRSTREWYWKHRKEVDRPRFFPVLERGFVRYLGSDSLGGGVASEIRVVLELGLERGDEGLLDRGFVVIGEGDRLAHLPLVGWFLSTDYCVKGGLKELGRVFGALEKRREREVVWLVAGLLEHGDAGVVKRARGFLVKRVGKDLGGEVKGWRDWVRAE